MCFSIAVVSTRMEGAIRLSFRSWSRMSVSTFSVPSGPSRFRNLHNVELSTKWASSGRMPQKTIHTMFSWSPCTTSSSDRSNRCFRIMRPTISRVGLGGRPVPERA